MSNKFLVKFQSSVKSVTTSQLSDSELRELLSLSKKGDNSARNKILLANMGLICSIAAEIKNPKAEYENLISDGCIRFLELINDYNPDVAALSTYMWRPIRQYMNENVCDYKHGLPQFAGIYGETVEYLSSKLGRNPSSEEIAASMGISKKVLNRRLADLRERSKISLDKPLNTDDSESLTLMDTEICKTSYDASTEVLKEDEEKFTVVAWNRLPSNERDILMLRKYENGKQISLREAAKISGLSTETIRKREIEAKQHFKEILDDYGIMAA